MSNPEAELSDVPGSNPERELSEEDILKRLEPKEEEDSTPSNDQGGGESEDETGQEQVGDQQEAGQNDPKEATPEELKWLSNKHKITVQGEELEITADEAFKGYMRQQDYTRKTTEAAELTKQAAQERQFVQREYAERINQLDHLAAALYQELVGDQSKLAELAHSDPAAWVAKQQEMAQKGALLSRVQQQHAQVEQMKKNEEQKAFLESVRTNEAKLLEALPDWRDSTKRAAEQREIANHLIQLGYTPDELNELTDHRAVLVARKAMLWDRAQAVKAKQTQEAKNPPKVVKPGTANSPTNAKTQQIQQLAQKAKRSGRDDDVIALLMARSDRG